MSADYDPHNHEQMKHLLGRYEFGRLSAEERRAFEAHLLLCDRCFAELVRGSRIVEILQAEAPRLLPLLERRPGWRRRRAWAVPWRGCLGLWPRVALPVAAGLLLLIAGIHLLDRGADPRQLATFPRHGIAVSAHRGAAEQDQLSELLITGSGYLETGRYADAERLLRRARRSDPGSAVAAYLLGLCLAHQSRIMEALPHLRFAAERADAALRPAALWVLANAYVQAGELAEARERLEILATMENDHRRAAGELLEALSAD